MSVLRDRTVEITKEYWEARESMTERLAIAQLAIALARAEFEAAAYGRELEARDQRSEGEGRGET